MSRKLSLFSALVIGAVSPLALHSGTASAVPVAGDLDGDLIGGAADCAPLDPSVHPGAVDRPDSAFTDTNCDGVDGDVANAVFVSTVGGNDAGTGTRLNPLKTVQAGIDAAASATKDVYVAGGTYAESVNLADDVSVYGGYALGFLSRSAAETTKIVGSGGPAALAVGDTGVVLQQLTLQGRPDGSGNSYGLRAINEGAAPSQIVLEKVQASADAAGAATHGSPGATGGFGTGFAGGSGGFGGSCTGVPGTPGSFSSVTGQGASGPNGANAAFVAQTGPTWLRQAAPSGTAGLAGGGGRGGQGGTGADNIGICIVGGTGGVGGRGGGGGLPGSGGLGGGGSFGVYTFNSSVVAVDSTLTGGPGGAGGNGASGGSGGFGAPGSAGLAGSCLSVFTVVCAQQGFPGQTGFPGGNGGGGGGGVGGPSAAVYQGGLESSFTQGSGTLLDFAGTAALGGLQGNTGIRAASGPTVDIIRPAGTPTASTYDFDGDSVADPADNCPADAGNVNGCPVAPVTSINSGPAEGSYLLSQSTSLVLGSTNAFDTLKCSLDGGDADTCTTPHALSGLGAGTHLFRAWATDSSGNADPTAAERRFTLPVNNTALTHSTGWTKKTGSGYFLNSYSTSTKLGASLSRSITNASRIALVATKAPGAGKVKIMLGNTLLREVNLNSTTTRKKQVFEQAFTAPRSGTVKLVVSTSGKPVRIEGLGIVTQ